MTPQPEPEDLAVLLRTLVRQYGVPGAQLAVRRHGAVSTAEAGEEVAGSDRPVTRETAFPLGSLTKPVTATLATVLVADGDVDLDAPVAAQLPELREGCRAAGVTCRQLLSHTGGLAAAVAEMPPGTTRQRWLTTYARDLVAHPPGTVFSYSNPGFLLLSRLVERVTGMDWRQAVEAVLLHPLGITPRSVVEPPGAAADQAAGADRALAQGHVPREAAAPLPVREQSVPALEEPVAGLAASARDLLAVAEALLPTVGGRPALLDAATATATWQDQLTDLSVGAYGLADGWGLGWSLYRRGGVTWFGHDGTGDGAWSHLRVEPASGTAVALTTNATTGAAMWEALVVQLRTQGVDIATHSPTVTGRPLSDPLSYAGRYTNGAWTCEVTADGTDLWLATGASAPSALTVSEDLRFMTAPDQGGVSYAGRFVPDPAGGRTELMQLAGRLLRRCV